MSLISCPECQHQVSSVAVGCPQCGYPIAGTAGEKAAETSPATGRETSRKLKVHAWLAWLVQFAGVGGFLYVVLTDDVADPDIGTQLLAVSIALFLCGFVWQGVTKVLEWWHQKKSGFHATHTFP